MKIFLKNCFWLFSILFLVGSLAHAQEDKAQPGDRERGRNILSDIWNTVKKNYYDPRYHGVNLEARYKDGLAHIDKATSFNQMLGIVAWFLEGLDDSHTFFIPPPHAFRLDYGWRAQMIDDRCFITRVRPGSDADKQGLKPGDQVESINTLVPTRDNLRKILYVFQVLRPQRSLHLAMRSPDGAQRTLDIQTSIKATNQQVTADNWMNEVRDSQLRAGFFQRKSARVGDVVIWKLYDFMMAEKGADNVVNEARGSKALILDLRGNPGGSADAVVRMVGHVFEQDVPVATFQARRKIDVPTTARGGGSKAYSGKLIVLVDSNSGSASEIFARVVQLEHRATVVGDRSAGAVMLSRHFSLQLGLDRIIWYGASVTEADLIMKDGKSLEHVGVIPDEVALPTAEDLASGRDPVLAKAVALAGGTLSPEDAGKMFPYEWLPQ